MCTQFRENVLWLLSSAYPRLLPQAVTAIHSIFTTTAKNVDHYCYMLRALDGEEAKRLTAKVQQRGAPVLERSMSNHTHHTFSCKDAGGRVKMLVT